MSRTRPEYLDARPSGRLTVGDVRFRGEPDEEEDEEEEEDKKDEGDSEEGDEEDDDENGGYSV
ncbi:MAG TPA: hypothetical protein VEV41_25715 [Terriglobales bacterium]|nr:hypothetical protein [Terriglobales bacterium]